MIGLGGAIGTGLFMGSGLAIGYAGPAVILSYAIAGFVALVMVFSLSEMAVVHPTAGSFGTYAETYLNPWAGFVVRYTYWIAQVIAIGGEAVAAGLYMEFWFPAVPGVAVVARLLPVLLYFNSRSVNNFGTVESWFALIKVTRDRAVHRPRRRQHPRLRSGPAVGLSQSHRPAGRILAQGARRGMDGRDRRHLLVQRHRGHRRHLRRGPESRRSRFPRHCAPWWCACSSSTCWRSPSS